MPKLELKRPEVAAKYSCTLEKDVIVHAKGYSGKLSMVNLDGADHIVKSGLKYLIPVPDNKKPVADQNNQGSKT